MCVRQLQSLNKKADSNNWCDIRIAEPYQRLSLLLDGGWSRRTPLHPLLVSEAPIHRSTHFDPRHTHPPPRVHRLDTDRPFACESNLPPPTLVPVSPSTLHFYVCKQSQICLLIRNTKGESSVPHHSRSDSQCLLQLLHGRSRSQVFSKSQQHVEQQKHPHDCQLHPVLQRCSQSNHP